MTQPAREAPAGPGNSIAFASSEGPAMTRTANAVRPRYYAQATVAASAGLALDLAAFRCSFFPEQMHGDDSVAVWLNPDVPLIPIVTASISR